MISFLSLAGAAFFSPLPPPQPAVSIVTSITSNSAHKLVFFAIDKTSLKIPQQLPTVIITIPLLYTHCLQKRNNTLLKFNKKFTKL